MEELIEHFNKVVNCFKVGQVVVIKINTDAEIQPSIATVHNLEVTKLSDNYVHEIYKSLPNLEETIPVPA